MKKQIHLLVFALTSLFVLVNAFGQVVFFENMEKYEEAGNWQIDLSDMASGVYHISISDGERMMVRRLVKQ